MRNEPLPTRSQPLVALVTSRKGSDSDSGPSYQQTTILENGSISRKREYPQDRSSYGIYSERHDSGVESATPDAGSAKKKRMESSLDDQKLVVTPPKTSLLGNVPAEAIVVEDDSTVEEGKSASKSSNSDISDNEEVSQDYLSPISLISSSDSPTPAPVNLYHKRDERDRSNAAVQLARSPRRRQFSNNASAQTQSDSDSESSSATGRRSLRASRPRIPDTELIIETSPLLGFAYPPASRQYAVLSYSEEEKNNLDRLAPSLAGSSERSVNGSLNLVERPWTPEGPITPERPLSQIKPTTERPPTPPLPEGGFAGDAEEFPLENECLPKEFAAWPTTARSSTADLWIQSASAQLSPRRLDTRLGKAVDNVVVPADAAPIPMSNRFLADRSGLPQMLSLAADGQISQRVSLADDLQLAQRVSTASASGQLLSQRMIVQEPLQEEVPTLSPNALADSIRPRVPLGPAEKYGSFPPHTSASSLALRIGPSSNPFDNFDPATPHVDGIHSNPIRSLPDTKLSYDPPKRPLVLRMSDTINHMIGSAESSIEESPAKIVTPMRMEVSTKAYDFSAAPRPPVLDASQEQGSDIRSNQKSDYESRELPSRYNGNPCLVELPLQVGHGEEEWHQSTSGVFREASASLTNVRTTVMSGSMNESEFPSSWAEEQLGARMSASRDKPEDTALVTVHAQTLTVSSLVIRMLLQEVRRRSGIHCDHFAS